MAIQGEQRSTEPVTVGQVLALESLIEAGVEVVAGGDGIEREVTWVHAGEIADIARYLRGGELLLTAGTGIGRSAADRVAYLEALVEAGASALVLEYGRAFRSVPTELRRAADDASLPLAVLKRNVPFAEVTRSVHGWIIGRRYALQTRVESMTLEFNDLLLSGGSVPQVLHKLHEITGKPTLLEDAAHQLVEYAGPADALEPLVANWAAHSRNGHRAPPVPSVAEDGQLSQTTSSRCAWAPVVLRGEPWGRIHVVSGEPLDDLDIVAANRASSALGLALLNHQHHARLAERARADLLDEAVRRAPEDPTSFLRQARSVGADFRGTELVALEIATSDAPVLALVNRLLAVASAESLPTLSSIGTESCRLLVGVPDGRGTAELVRRITTLAGEEDSQRLTVGVSRPSTVSLLPRAFHEAQECLRFARISHAGGVLEYSTLGLHLLLASLADGPQLASFIETELGPLLEHDANARSPLLPTLRALLAHDSNRAEAARAVHVERRSIYYRLKRIEAVLGQSLDDPDVKLGLSVALRALSLVEDRSVLRSGRR